MSNYNLCECSDKQCPACKGKCKRIARTVLYRVDMEDVTGTAFCNMCADDAMESGLFTDSKEDDDQQEQDESPVYCPMCDSGDSSVLGTLGKRVHYRCNECGMYFSHSSD